MALWQYTFQVLPKNSYDFLGGDKIVGSKKDFTFVDEPYWEYQAITKSIFSELEQVLGKGFSWSDEIDLYGIQDSNCFEVLFDKENFNVISASFRIDFTEDYEMILQGIIEFCILNGFIILDEELQLVPLNYESVKSIIYNAPQVRKYNQLKNKE